MKKLFYFITLLLVLPLSGCASNEEEAKKITLDPKNPVTISIWHYYNGAIMNAFQGMIKEFNETIGEKEGIIVESHGCGDVSELEQAVMSSAKKEVGSKNMPDIFATYADTAYEAEKMGILANLERYFTKEEQQEYLDSFIEEGKIGVNGELKIFPIAKSTEALMINETDWLPFAKENNLTYENMATMEEIVNTAELYYNWTDAKTPNVPNDGKALFGRDSMANFFIISSKAFGTEIFQIQNGVSTINVNENVMKKIWDCYYVPYISGYFSAYGRFRSDDTKVGDIISYVGSTSSVAYFPNEVTINNKTYPIAAKILPIPHFKDAKKVMVQQGAGMVVAKSTAEKEYASTVFLKWFTGTQENIEFSSLSGYMPVKKDAMDYDKMISQRKENGQTVDEKTSETLKIALQEMKTSEFYTNKAIDGGVAARNILEYNLQDKAVADREMISKLLKKGKSLEEAIAQFDTEEKFKNWLQDITEKLNETLK